MAVAYFLRDLCTVFAKSVYCLLLQIEPLVGPHTALRYRHKLMSSNLLTSVSD
jgi:hypothetical protein